MKTTLRTEKFKYLEQNGYDIHVARDNSGWTATHKTTGLEIHFTDNTMTVNNEYGSQHSPWIQLSMPAFMLICEALNIVPLTSEVRDETQRILNENYACQFLGLNS